MKKKICIIRASDITYISRVHRTAQALEESGKYDVCVLSIIPRDDKKRIDYPYKMKYVSIKTRAFKSSFFSIIRIIEGLIRLFFSARKQKADIYIPIGIEDLVIVYIISKFFKTKFIYSANELEGDRKRTGNQKLNALLNRTVIKIEKFMLKKADIVIAADLERARLMEKWHGLDKVEVIRNVPIHQNITNKNLIRNHLKISKDFKVVLYQGLLSEGRGLEVSIEACSQAKSRKFYLVFLGFITEEYRNKLMDLAKELDFDRFHILPPVSWKDLLFWTKSADICMVLIEHVSISYYLAAPNKLYESIMARVPYIASNFPEINHVHEVSRSGILVDPKSTKEITKALDKLISDPLFYSECVENSNNARDIFNWDKEKIKLLNLVSQIEKNID